MWRWVIWWLGRARDIVDNDRQRYIQKGPPNFRAPIMYLPEALRLPSTSFYPLSPTSIISPTNISPPNPPKPDQSFNPQTRPPPKSHGPQNPSRPLRQTQRPLLQHRRRPSPYSSQLKTPRSPWYFPPSLPFPSPIPAPPATTIPIYLSSS